MEHSAPLQAPARRPSFRKVLRGIAVPLFLFAFILVALLLLSFQYLLPLYSRVEVDGGLKTAEELHTYNAQLTQSLLEQEQERNRAILPLADPQYDAFKTMRRSQADFLSARREILRTAQVLVSEKDAVHIAVLSLDEDGRTLSLQGDVRNVDTRSMTVLAEFVEAVGHLPFVASLTTPVYERQEDPTAGFHSPFIFSLVLR